MQKISPCLWFDTQAEEAAKFYLTIFPNSRITKLSRYGEGGRMPKGLALMVAFELDGVAFLALNGQCAAIHRNHLRRSSESRDIRIPSAGR